MPSSILHRLLLNTKLVSPLIPSHSVGSNETRFSVNEVLDWYNQSKNQEERKFIIDKYIAPNEILPETLIDDLINKFLTRFN